MIFNAMKAVFYKSRQFYMDMRLRNKIAISFVIVVILSIVPSGYFFFIKASELIDLKSKEYIYDINKQITENIEEKLTGLEELSYDIFTDNSIQDVLTNARTEMDEHGALVLSNKISNLLSIYSIRWKNIKSICIITNKGHIFTVEGYLNGNATSEFDFININYYEPFLSELEEAKGSVVYGRPVAGLIPIGREINSILTQKRIGYLILLVPESLLFDLYSQTKVFLRGDLYIINSEGFVISNKNKELIGSQLDNEIAESSLNHISDEMNVAKIDGNYISHNTVGNNGWSIINIIPIDSFQYEIILLNRIFIIIITFIILFSIFFSVGLSNNLTKPTRALLEKMKWFGKGNFDAYSPYASKSEIGQLSAQFNIMVKQINTLIQEGYEKGLLKQEAELRYLRAQINPHFLGNTLESMNWIARNKNFPEIVIMIESLGNLFKYIIKSNDFATVKEEIENVGHYLNIQKVRYGDRFDSIIELPSKIMEQRVPKLILQPIIENSFIHGIENKVDKSSIKIKGKMFYDRFSLIIIDNGLGIKKEKLENIFNNMEVSKTTGIGIKNINDRIKIIYGEDYGLEIKSKYNMGTKVIITFPIFRDLNMKD